MDSQYAQRFARACTLADQLTMELHLRASTVNRHMDYYKGRQPLRFASSEYRKYWASQYEGFADNWVQPVADSPVERLTVTGIRLAEATSADKDLWEVWQRNGLDADSQLGFTAAACSARAFVLVWGDPQNPDVPEVTFEDARQAIVAYAPGSRRKRVAALKSWQDGSRQYATLYLPGEVWKLKRAMIGAEPRKSSPLQAVDDLLAEREEPPGWELRDIVGEPNPQPNPMGVVPMVELANRPLLADEPLSDVSGVVAMQDSVNLVWSYLFTAAEGQADPQRVVLGQKPPMMPVLDHLGKVIGSKPVPIEKFVQNRVMFFENEKARIDTWPAANLSAYTDVIEVAVGHIAAQTRTPQHYLIGRMANLSGDALIAAETGLVKKVGEKQMWFGQALREVFRLVALARGNEGLARRVAGGEVQWADAQSRNQSQLADALLKLKQIGFPFEWLAAKYGLTPTEIGQVLVMREEEAALDPLSGMVPGAGFGAAPGFGSESAGPGGAEDGGMHGPQEPEGRDDRAR